MATDRPLLTTAPATADDEDEPGGDGDGDGGPKVEIPKPILIVVIVVIALGVVSCAIGGLRGLTDGPPAADQDLIDRFDGFLDPRPIPAAELGLAGLNGGSCNRVGAIIQVSGTCRLLVDARIFPPRELRVRIDSGNATVVVRQEVQGEVETTDPEGFGFADVFDVSGGGTNDVEVFVACGGAGCDLRVLQ